MSINPGFHEIGQHCECYNERHKEVSKLKSQADALLDYVTHTDRCILSFWEAGEPTQDGGYRMKFAGKWYQSRPIDETPKCNCGLDEIMKWLK